MKTAIETSEQIESYATKIVYSAFQAHKQHGPGLLEKVYGTCFCCKLNKRELKYKRQVDLPIVYDNITFNDGLRLDVRRKFHNI